MGVYDFKKTLDNPLPFFIIIVVNPSKKINIGLTHWEYD